MKFLCRHSGKKFLNECTPFVYGSLCKAVSSYDEIIYYLVASDKGI